MDVEKRKSEVCVNGAMHFQSHIWILISCHKQWSPCASLLELWPPATDWSTSPAQWGCWRSGGYQQGSKSIRLIDVGATQSEVSSLAFSLPMKKIPDDEMSHSGPALMSVWLPAPPVSVSVLAEVRALTINWNDFYHRPLPHAHPHPPYPGFGTWLCRHFLWPVATNCPAIFPSSLWDWFLYYQQFHNHLVCNLL